MKKLLEQDKRVKIGINLSPDLLKWVDVQAGQESRSRSRMIECILSNWRALDRTIEATCGEGAAGR